MHREGNRQNKTNKTVKLFNQKNKTKHKTYENITNKLITLKKLLKNNKEKNTFKPLLLHGKKSIPKIVHCISEFENQEGTDSCLWLKCIMLVIKLLRGFLIC